MEAIARQIQHVEGGGHVGGCGLGERQVELDRGRAVDHVADPIHQRAAQGGCETRCVLGEVDLHRAQQVQRAGRKVREAGGRQHLALQPLLRRGAPRASDRQVDAPDPELFPPPQQVVEHDLAQEARGAGQEHLGRSRRPPHFDTAPAA
jgi:hypothetical protein